MEFFNCKTLPALLGGFGDSDLWSRLLLQLTEGEAAVHHAVVALSSFHEISDAAGFKLCKERGRAIKLDARDRFALKQYTKAVSGVRERLAGNEDSKTVTLVCCILFVCLEFVRGQKASAMAHLQSGLHILRHKQEQDAKRLGPLLQNPLHAPPMSTDIVEGDLAPMFSRLSLIQSMYGQPRTSEFGPTEKGPFVGLIDIQSESTACFHNLSEARIACMNLLNYQLRFMFLIDYDKFPTPEALTSFQSNLIDSYDAWSTAFDTFLATKPPEDMLGANLLKMHHKSTLVWVKVSPSKLQTPFDEYRSEFEEVVGLAEIVISDIEARIISGQGFNTFTLDMGLISELFWAALKCRDHQLRQKAIDLLGRSPHKEGLWDSIEARKVAELVVAVEEEDLQDPLSEVPAETSRVYDIDVWRRDMTSDQFCQVVNLRMNPSGVIGDNIWREEYIYWP